ncbi:Fe-S cluster assembly protein SufD [Thermomonas sp.]|uniref:Fe-S cluster assembly protein SufD n=1 Tax=Thermomonas sp. TaxID=1971895 RepID=UPI002489A442|nr:Fe-S cluster assembly protein SufD [Thermomonas sp.]MDI1251921.1 Fe-S cluster assembly protein SufD [Thermomonas sp.]
MSVLLDSLTAGFDGDPARRAALDALLRDGLPHARVEAWKYTPLRALERRIFVAADSTPETDTELLAGIPAPRLVFVNGQFDVASSDYAAVSAGVTIDIIGTPVENTIELDADAPFARLNTVLAHTGVAIRIEADAEASAPIHIVCIGTPLAADAAWHLRHRIELDTSANCTVIEHLLASGEHAHMSTTRSEIVLGDGARLIHARMQDEAVRATSFLRTDAALADNAHYTRIDLELGGGLSRHELNVLLQGNGARVNADGVLLADGKRHLDTRLGIEHIGRDTVCALRWRGLASQRGKAVFHGGITIHAGADGSEADLSNKNLLLSNEAEIDTQPVLEIYADEVKAAHGATVGQLDPTALFYLRSRGLTEADARRLLTAAFCREIVSGIDDASLRTQLESALERALARVVAARVVAA